MQIYIQSIDFELWNAITNGSEQLPQKHQHKVEYEVRAKDIILDALSPIELCRVAKCKSAREIWEKLQQFHENVCLLTEDDDGAAQQRSSKHSSTIWYLDSGCSKHMTGDETLVSNLTLKDAGHATYGDNNQGKIKGFGSIEQKTK